MKISDVCQKTGLTRRAVRFYEEKGLIRPKSEDRNGRNFREYDDEDARRLSAVADLRKLEFSVDEISVMIDAPERIGGLVKERRLALAEEIRCFMKRRSLPSGLLLTENTSRRRHRLAAAFFIGEGCFHCSIFPAGR